MFRMVLLAICAFVISPVEAAQFKRLKASDFSGNSIAYIELEGPITAGDVDRLDKLIREGDSDILLSLNSSGGDFQAGIALAKYINAKPIATTVKGSNQCISACAIAFLGGTLMSEESSIWPARSIDPTAKVGFHAPFLEVTEGQYNAERISRAYDRAVRTIVQTVRAAPSMQVSAEDVAALMVAQREELVVLDTTERLGRYAVFPRALKMPKRLTRSMAVSLCVNGWALSHTEGYELRTDETDLFDLALGTMESSNWSASVSSFRSTTPFGEDALSMVIPIGPGAEGSLTFCIVDQVAGDYKRIACRGFIRYERISEAVEVAREWGDVEIPCDMPTPVDPERDRGEFLDNNAWALVPPRTALAEIKKTLETFAETEKALPKP